MFRKDVGRGHTLVVFFLVFLWAVFEPISTQASSFFTGRRIRVVVGAIPGGGFDTFARLLARHLPRYIPGRPKIIVQNMPGAGSLVAANRIYAEQPGDGLTIVTFASGIVVQALMGDPAAKFDPLKYLWLGDPALAALPRVLWIRGDLPIRSLDDLRKRKEPLAVGATGVGTSIAITGEFERFLGLPIKNVYGYRGVTSIMAALERKELEGVNLSQYFVQDRFGHLIKKGLIRPLLSIGNEPRFDALQGVETLKDFTLYANQQKLTDFLLKTWSVLRLYALPPGTPPDRYGVLQEAFLKALKSPKLIKDAKRQHVRLDPRSGKEVFQIIRDLTKAPPDVVENYKKLLRLKK